jgi:2'-5' RNA ligase
VPDEPILGQIMALKQEVFERFNSKGALNSPPHITLHMPFQWRVDREEMLLEILSNFRILESGFYVHLDGFDYFESRVVFVDVLENPDLRALYKKLSRFTRRELKLLNADYKSRGFHPHVTIGFRDLKKTIFSQAKNYYQNKSYSAKFLVEGIYLLKHNGTRWEKFRYFNFKG